MNGYVEHRSYPLRSAFHEAFAIRRFVVLLRVPFMGFVLIWRSGCGFRRTGCNASVSGYTIAGNYPTVTLA